MPAPGRASQVTASPSFGLPGWTTGRLQGWHRLPTEWADPSAACPVGGRSSAALAGQDLAHRRGEEEALLQGLVVHAGRDVAHDARRFLPGDAGPRRVARKRPQAPDAGPGPPGDEGTGMDAQQVERGRERGLRLREPALGQGGIGEVLVRGDPVGGRALLARRLQQTLRMLPGLAAIRRGSRNARRRRSPSGSRRTSPRGCARKTPARRGRGPPPPRRWPRPLRASSRKRLRRASGSGAQRAPDSRATFTASRSSSRARSKSCSSRWSQPTWPRRRTSQKDSPLRRARATPSRRFLRPSATRPRLTWEIPVSIRATRAVKPSPVSVARASASWSRASAAAYSLRQ